MSVHIRLHKIGNMGGRKRAVVASLLECLRDCNGNMAFVQDQLTIVSDTYIGVKNTTHLRIN